MVRHPGAEATAGLRELPAQALDRRASTDPKRWDVKRKTPHKRSALGRGLCDVFVVYWLAVIGYLCVVLSKSCANQAIPCFTWLERGCKTKFVLQNEALLNKPPLNEALSVIPFLANQVVLRANRNEPYVECCGLFTFCGVGTCARRLGR